MSRSSIMMSFTIHIVEVTKMEMKIRVSNAAVIEFGEKFYCYRVSTLN